MITFDKNGEIRGKPLQHGEKRGNEILVNMSFNQVRALLRLQRYPPQLEDNKMMKTISATTHLYSRL